MMSGKADNFSGETISDGKAKNISASQTNGSGKPPAMFQRIADGDMSAVRECIDAYGNVILALAKKFTDSTEEAETATQEIFLDLWKYADCFAQAKMCEKTFIFLIARRRLSKGKEKSVSAAKN